jgi:hypothetical protein
VEIVCCKYFCHTGSTMQTVGRGLMVIAPMEGICLSISCLKRFCCGIFFFGKKKGRGLSEKPKKQKKEEEKEYESLEECT